MSPDIGEALLLNVACTPSRFLRRGMDDSLDQPVMPGVDEDPMASQIKDHTLRAAESTQSMGYRSCIPCAMSSKPSCQVEPQRATSRKQALHAIYGQEDLYLS